VKPGVPDLLLLLAGRLYLLELKALRGRLSDDQIETQEKLRQAGAVVGNAVGLDQAIAWLEDHGLLRGKAQVRRPADSCSMQRPRHP
jgi:hypothetical protein